MFDNSIINIVYKKKIHYKLEMLINVLVINSYFYNL